MSLARSVDPKSAAARSGGAVPAHDVLQPGRSPRLDAPGRLRGLGRAVLLAPPFAILLLLAAAGAAWAADGLEPVDAALAAPVVPPVDPRLTDAPPVGRLGPVQDRVLKTVVKALPDGTAKVVDEILGRAEDKVDPVSPVPIAPLLPREPRHGPDETAEPGQPQPRAADDAGLAPAGPITTSPGPKLAPSIAWNGAELDGPRVSVLQPLTPPGSIDPTTTVAIGASGTGPGPWLGNGAPAGVPPPGSSAFPPAIPMDMPRGRTPRPLVPPG
jgi:hypothetical protein